MSLYWFRLHKCLSSYDFFPCQLVFLRGGHQKQEWLAYGLGRFGPKVYGIALKAHKDHQNQV
jgi:hypothetical protein